jgi:hypothetical protein
MMSGPRLISWTGCLRSYPCVRCKLHSSHWCSPLPLVLPKGAEEDMEVAEATPWVVAEAMPLVEVVAAL